MYSRSVDVPEGSNTKNMTSSNSSKKVNKRITNIQNRLTRLDRYVKSSAPVAVATRSGSKGNDLFPTKGTERVSTVTVLNTSYNVVSVYINPANKDLFPWLSGIAKKYDLYRVKRLSFRYKPAISTDTPGNVYLGVDYNTLDPSPPSSNDFCQLTKWTTNAVWKPCGITLDVKGTDWLYTRSGSVANADYKTYDLGKFFFATEGISVTDVVGYVEVDYDIEFCRRQPDYVSTSPEEPSTTFGSPYMNIYTSSNIAVGNDGLVPISSLDVVKSDEITISNDTFSTGITGLYFVDADATGTSDLFIRIGSTERFLPCIVNITNSDTCTLYSTLTSVYCKTIVLYRLA